MILKKETKSKKRTKFELKDQSIKDEKKKKLAEAEN